MAHAALSGQRGPAAFFADAVDAFARAAERAGGAVEAEFDLLGRRVLVRCAGPALVPALTGALDHRRRPPGAGSPDLTFCAWDEASTGVGVPPAPWPPTAYGAKGVIDGFNDDRFSTVFAPGVDLLNAFDRARGVGLFWIEDAAAVPYWERGFPFRTLLHWATAGSPAQLVHSGAVGIDGTGVLLTGAGGSGKSTTTLLCLRAGMDYAGDDYVAFELSSPPQVHSLYSTAKVDPPTLERFPELVPLVGNAGGGDEKALLFLSPALAPRLASPLRLRAVLLPHVTGGPETRLEPASPVAAVRALAPTTVFQLPRQDTESFRRVVELSRRVPAFTLHLGTDVERIPEVVAGVVEGRFPA